MMMSQEREQEKEPRKLPAGWEELAERVTLEYERLKLRLRRLSDLTPEQRSTATAAVVAALLVLLLVAVSAQAYSRRAALNPRLSELKGIVADEERDTEQNEPTADAVPAPPVQRGGFSQEAMQTSGKEEPQSFGPADGQVEVEIDPSLPRPGLEDILRNLAGPHNDPIIVVAANAIYLDFLENWCRILSPSFHPIVVCAANRAYLDYLERRFFSVQRFGYGQKVLFIAEDAQALQYMSRRWPWQTVDRRALLDLALHDNEEFNAAEKDPNEYRCCSAAAFNSLTARKPAYFEALLHRNLPFLYNDIDCVWLEDPFAYFTGDFDMWATHNTLAYQQPTKPDVACIPFEEQKLSTSILMVKANEWTRQLIRDWLQAISESKIQKDSYDPLDMTVFNDVLRNESRKAAVGVLPLHSFPPGALLLDQRFNAEFNEFMRNMEAKVAIAHGSWVKSHDTKRERFENASLWLVGPIHPSVPQAPPKLSPDEGRLQALAGGDPTSWEWREANGAKP